MKNIRKDRPLENVLEIEYIKTFNRYAVRISYQDEEVFKRGIFKDDELGVHSVSYFCYDNYVLNDTRYVLRLNGKYTEKDSDEIILTESELSDLLILVDKINEKYGKKRRWRAEYGGEYYYLNEYLEVIYGLELNSNKDKRLYDIGNYFRYQEDAEKHINKLKNIFKEEL